MKRFATYQIEGEKALGQPWLMYPDSTSKPISFDSFYLLRDLDIYEAGTKAEALKYVEWTLDLED